MDWYVVDKEYIKYLVSFDSRIGYVEYGERLKNVQINPNRLSLPDAVTSNF